MDVLRAENLNATLPDGRVLFKGLSFSLKKGEVILVQGKNGSGKSTLLKQLCGLGKTPGGVVQISSPREKRRYLPQIENSEYHLPLLFRDILEWERPQSWEEVFEIGLLEEKHLNLAWNTASGGERKRLLLTRLLLSQPELIFLDEPLNHLDVSTRKKVLSVLSKRVREKKTAVILVSHSDKETDWDVQVQRIQLGGAHAPSS